MEYIIVFIISFCIAVFILKAKLANVKNRNNKKELIWTFIISIVGLGIYIRFFNA